MRLPFQNLGKKSRALVALLAILHFRFDLLGGVLGFDFSYEFACHQTLSVPGGGKGLLEKVLHHVPVNIRQPEIPPLIVIGQLGVIDP